MKLSKNFTSQEFECPCGKCKAKRQIIVEISPILVSKLQLLRDRVGEPIYITSGVRCKAYNKKIGGYSKSPHLDGLAVDIKIDYMSSAYIKNMPVTLAHIASKIANIRIGIYPNHLHIDIVPPHPSKYWFVKAYGQKVIYSGKENNLAKFLKNNL